MAKKAAKPKKKPTAPAAGNKKRKVTIEVFDPFGPGFRVFHKQGVKRTHIGGSAELAADDQTGDKLTLDIFDPFGPGFRVVNKTT
ncbi:MULTISPECIES: hypothetical protein [unclassified Bradyrhizobium]|uniref:hypothetical protein n=1 Tax=unclassified Bradyrhizobium TaxID=2631580 RepID=UPI00291600A4|nr:MULTISPECIES: hypothetical protein [unclassified Bradyrhizobium]